MTATTIEETVGKGFLSVLSLSIAMPFLYMIRFPFAILDAWALAVMYGWFILPLFPALPAIGIVPMMGVSAFKGALLYRPATATTKDAKKTAWSLIFDLPHGPATLVFAYPIHWWMT